MKTKTEGTRDGEVREFKTRNGRGQITGSIRLMWHKPSRQWMSVPGYTDKLGVAE